jgi:hypothetical protein
MWYGQMQLYSSTIEVATLALYVTFNCPLSPVADKAGRSSGSKEVRY